jgi:hypothetical protein
MKNKNTILVVLAIILLLGIILLVTKKEITFRTYTSLNSNSIQNFVESKTYLDTIVMVGLDKLGIGGYSVQIRPQQGTAKIDDEFTAEAFILGNQYNSVIYTKESLNRYSAIKILAHELIHLEQYRSGKIKKLGNGSIEWNGELIEDITTIPYNEREWEKEAFDRGSDLEKEIRKELIEPARWDIH